VEANPGAKTGRPDPLQFFGNDRVEPEIVLARPAEFFGRAHPQEALPAQPQPQIAVYLALFFPVVVVWHNFFLDKAPERVAEHLVFGIE
jgi:hypothetical protein